jgi:hypothetical protein
MHPRNWAHNFDAFYVFTICFYILGGQFPNFSVRKLFINIRKLWDTTTGTITSRTATFQAKALRWEVPALETSKFSLYFSGSRIPINPKPSVESLYRATEISGAQF